MKNFLIAGAVGALLMAAPLAASAMPFSTATGGSADTILVGGGHGHGHGYSMGHSRGRHLGWEMGRHRGWGHSHHRWHG